MCHCCPKHITQVKSGQKWPKSNHLNSFIKVKSKSLVHTVWGTLLVWKGQAEQNVLGEKVRDAQKIGFFWCCVTELNLIQKISLSLIQSDFKSAFFYSLLHSLINRGLFIFDFEIGKVSSLKLRLVLFLLYVTEANLGEHIQVRIPLSGVGTCPNQ